MIALAAPCAAQPDADLVMNPGFEQGHEGWQIETGAAGDVAGGENRCEVRAAEAHSGDRCLYLQYLGKAWLWLDTGTEEAARLSLRPGRFYSMTLAARWLSGDDRLAIGFNERGREDLSWVGCWDGQAVLTVPRDGKWHVLRTVVQAPDHDGARHFLQLKIGGHAAFGQKAFEMLVDDVAIEETRPAGHVFLRYRDASPEDGWGPNAEGMHLCLPDPAEPVLWFEPFTQDEAGFLVESTAGGYGKVRVADGNQHFVYRLPVHPGAAYTVEQALWGHFVVEASGDGKTWVELMRAGAEGKTGGKRLARRLTVAHLGGGMAGIVVVRGAPSGAHEARLPAALVPLDPAGAAGAAGGAGVTVRLFSGGRRLRDLAVDLAAGGWSGDLLAGDLPSPPAGLPLRERLVLDLCLGVLGPDGALLATPTELPGVLALDPSTYRATLERIAEARERLGQSLADAEARRRFHGPAVNLAVLERLTRQAQLDAREGYVRRCAIALEELVDLGESALTEIGSGRGSLPIEPPPSTMRLAIRDGALWQGSTPVFLLGPMRDRIEVEDLEHFGAMGFNAVELVVAPAWDQSDRREEHLKYYRDFLREAERLNIAVYVLLSSHYVGPDWYERFPDIIEPHPTHRGGFMPYCLTNPHTRELLAEWYRQVLPAIKDSPALFCHCLANEPHWADGDGLCPHCNAAFRAYLRERHGSIERLNALWGTGYASFEEITDTPPGGDAPAARRLDWMRFNDRRLADLFVWERQAVRETDARTPIMTELMAFHAFNRRLGIDFELATEYSDMHGCDSAWPDLLEYDLMRSIEPELPIFNSEWHVMDQGSLECDPLRQRARLWLSYAHGLNAATVWAWLRDFPREASLMLCKPAAVAAMGRTLREMQHFAREITALQRAPRPVRVLYSPTNIAAGPAHADAARRAWEALSFCDVAPGFLTERQVAGRGFADCRLLVVPAAERLGDDVVSGLQAFARDGGRLVCLGACGELDEYGVAPRARRVPRAWRSLGAVEDWSAESLQARLLSLVEEAGLRGWARVGRSGVVCRPTTCEGAPLALVMNCTEGAVGVGIHGPGGGGMRDLITGESLSGTVSLPPWRPYLLAPAMRGD